MTKSELIEKLKSIQKEDWNCMRDGYDFISKRERVGIYGECIRYVEQLEDAREECEFKSGHQRIDDQWKCFGCKNLFYCEYRRPDKWNFCPNCGAKIKRGEK